eukprot:TRINITY_DN31028_c0_g1_i1.p1 TRINITY_DN31028_c0_g1~~TRINITY_DN31028_c0_g1_i1.p1  ORF type:complete len:493 (+),score=136.30 TRINITY_DN31028_c0_g1_i1:58-1536(+)
MRTVLPLLLAAAADALRDADVRRAHSSAPADFPKYKTNYFNQTLDHFRFGEPRSRFMQRYLTLDTHWTGKGRLPNGCKGPILFYTGNEGPVTAFWSGNGFMLEELAPEWGALVVFAEERYYGESLPFGAKSLDPANSLYLSTEQVLADYAVLITHLKSTLDGAQNCPVVAFGGSYGGTLTTYMRVKYPQIVVGGLAASAPTGYYANTGWKSHGVDAYTWIDIVNKDFSEAQPGCLQRIRQVTDTINQQGKTSAGRQSLAKTFHLCDPAQLGATHASDYWTDAIESIPQGDYPYAIGSMPANPVNATCSVLMQASDADLLTAAAQVTDWYFGYDGSQCLKDQGFGGIPGGPGPCPPEQGAWCQQSCTETLHQFSARGVRDFTFNMTEVLQQCRQYYNVEPDPLWGEVHFGGYGIGDGVVGVSNLIWSNGGRDPWHGGGFLTPRPGTSNTWLWLPNGAHHSDLRGAHPEDPPDVVAARATEKKIIRGWIDAASQ